MKQTIFGKTKDGKTVTLYTIRNQKGMRADIMDYGGTIVSLHVPDATGKDVDVVLGYDTVKEYEEGGYYFGAVIGRNANRIAGASCRIDGITYKLEENDASNNLHSGSNGFHHALWNVEKVTENSIQFSYLSKAFEQGFPGNLKVFVLYELTENNELTLTYQATTDRVTIANMTNHSYFNLDGHEAGSIEEQFLTIYASSYMPMIDSESIPTGTMDAVEGTPMDFRKEKAIGKDIGKECSQLHFAEGYDHNFVLDKETNVFGLAAEAYSKKSGIAMKVFTTCPGIQFYSGNFLKDGAGKKGATYHFRQGFCLETQYFPNAVNEQAFETPFLKPGEQYEEKTVYQFAVKKDK